MGSIAAPVASAAAAPDGAARELVPLSLAALTRELNDRAQRDLRFKRQPGGLISLRDADEFQSDELFDLSASSPEAARRVHFWRNR